MKKLDVLKTISPEYQSIVRPLERLNLYYISINLQWRVGVFGPGNTEEKYPALLTHFYKHGIKFKILVSPCRISHNGYLHVRYTRLQKYILTPMPAEDLPLFVGQAHPHMSEAFLKAKPYRKPHKT